MWLLHTETGQEGWHICQMNQREPCKLLVFVKEGGIWKMKLWNSKDTRIRSKTYQEELEDESSMTKVGPRIFTTPLSSYY